MKKTLFLIMIFSLFFTANIVLAQDENVVVIPDPLGEKTLGEIINGIIDNFLAPIGFGIAVILIIWSGIQYMTAGGSEEKIRKAKQTLMWTIIGLAILISARFIVLLIEEILKGAGA
jgi:hypothetical protein